MSKNSLKAHMETGEIWKSWIESGGHYKSLKEGAQRQKLQEAENKKVKERKPFEAKILKNLEEKDKK